MTELPPSLPWMTGQLARKYSDGVDLYRTPPNATRALLDEEPLSGTVWEPACGDGAISRVLGERGLEVISTDLHNHGYGVSGIDFYTCEPVRNEEGRLPDAIMTNPPFQKNGLERFALRAIEMVQNKVILLGRLSQLESKRRYDFWRSMPLKRVWVFSDRIPMARIDLEKAIGRARMVPFAWYVFELGYTGEPMLGWLRYEEEDLP